MKSIVLILLVFSAYRPLSQTAIGPNLDETEILEAVFRHQIGHCYDNRFIKLHFLSYKGTDPPEALMESFKNYKPPVRKRSQMVGFKDKQTGERGILQDIRSINWMSDSVVQVKGTCGAAALDAHSYEYRVVRKNGRRTVKSHKLIGVS